MSTQSRLVIAALLALSAAGVAVASGASFRISAAGVELGKPDDADADVPKYKLKAKLGETLTLVAEGVVAPRGAAEGPGDIDAGAWLFDDEAFRLVPAEKAKSGKTRAVVALTPLKPGTHRVRFVGDILGRYHKYDVMVEVAGK